MDGMLSQFRALNSETSLTSSQEQAHEPHHCFNDTCAFPFGDACSECRTAALEKEKRRMELTEATRPWKWIEDDDLCGPTSRTVALSGEQEREEERQRWFEYGTNSRSACTSVPTLGSVESLGSLQEADSNVFNLEANQSLRGLRETVTTAPSLSSHRLAQRTENRNSQKDQRRSSGSSISSESTIFPEKASIGEMNETPTEVRDTLITQHWLSTLPSLADMANPFNPQPQSCRVSSQSITSSIVDAPTQQAQVILKATPKLIKVAARPRQAQPRPTPPRQSRNRDLCPLCSRPIGDPTFQHLLKCQFAHDEKAKLDETMRRLKL